MTSPWIHKIKIQNNPIMNGKTWRFVDEQIGLLDLDDACATATPRSRRLAGRPWPRPKSAKTKGPSTRLRKPSSGNACAQPRRKTLMLASTPSSIVSCFLSRACDVVVGTTSGPKPASILTTCQQKKSNSSKQHQVHCEAPRLV